MKFNNIRLDWQVIFGIVEQGSKVLDLGCGTGELLFLLAKEKNVQAHGIELDEQAIYKCVEKGLSVFHGDIDSGLSDYPDKSFDYVILNQSLQQVKKVDFVIQEAFRVGKKVIVGFPNFAQISARLMLGFAGKAPLTKSLPFRWFDSPNVHFLSISDFRDYCKERKIKVDQAYYLGSKNLVYFLPNLLAINAVFVLTK